MRARLLVIGLGAALCVPTAAVASAQSAGRDAIPAGARHVRMHCEHASQLCTEVAHSDDVFGHYVGHDEPAVAFYSNQKGSGNAAQYSVTLPGDPSPKQPTTKSYHFELDPALWFGMVVCDTQSSPRPLGDPKHPINRGSKCTPNSDTNIKENPNPNAKDALAKHAGNAFVELQMYPPGWVGWPDNGASCDPTKWCAALNIDSLARDDLNGTTLNDTCAQLVGEEYVNFAFLTLNGTPQPDSPPNPVESTLDTFTPNPNADLFMNSGDKLNVTMHDTRHGLETDIDDLTAGTHGSMTASAANGFGQVQYDPAGTSCINLPYDFRPMYSTSSEKTRPTWTGHALNVSIADEIGHFDYCTSISNKTGSCTGKEGPATDRSPHDADDNFCFPASSSPLVKIAGCTDSNVGFDGPSYQPVWPDGGASHPAPWIFGAPKTGASFTTNYSRLAFEADLPLIEDHSFSPGNDCNDETGGGCVVPPLADNGAPAAFYPFWSTTSGFGDACDLVLGSDIPGHTVSDFGGVHQYGALLAPLYLDYGGQGAATQLFSDNRQVLSDNPCTR